MLKSIMALEKKKLLQVYNLEELLNRF